MKAATHRAIGRYQKKERVDLDALVRQHTHVIDRCARALVRKTGIVSIFDDLWSAGAMGLVDAAQRYKPEAGRDFVSFVEHRIRGAMLDELRRMDHLPRRLRTKVKRVEKTKDQLHRELGRDATTEEVAEEMDVEVTDVHRLESLSEPTVSLEALGGASTRPDDKIGALTLIEGKEKKEHLTQAITELPERLRVILALRYTETLSFREIGEILSVSDARVAQLHRRALGLLKESLANSPAAS